MAVKLGYKYSFIFAATTLMAIMLWGRNGEDDDNPLGYKDEGDDRVIHRSKRQSYESKLRSTFDFLKQAERCCRKKFPYLLPEDSLTTCQNGNANKNPNSAKNKAGKNRKKQGRRSLGLLQAVNNLLKSSNRPKRASPQKMQVSSVCYMACIFNDAGLLNGSAVNLDETEATFNSSNEVQYWAQPILDAISQCEEPAACATPETIKSPTGRFCNIKPTVYMCCMYQKLYEKCDPDTSRPGCKDTGAKIRKLDTSHGTQNRLKMQQQQQRKKKN
ncbi:uncharacterized protein LOC132203399 [Neocloeon triangulifer]|uniref:uncharacterized protein LOC132203399 n=1 Tax=Neocloeon triangulifer TaxID=2078957 RepID=UPI00286F6F08|nr:uncharacterized protein LOC132203399 [Neocloeon triangulifer]